MARRDTQVVTFFTRERTENFSGDPDMDWTSLIAYFFGGAFLANAIPHTVAGMMGKAFQTPFAKPPGRGLSSSIVNVTWGFVNIAAGYLLIEQVGDFDLRSLIDVLAAGTGAVAIGVPLAWHFGKFHGGTTPR